MLAIAALKTAVPAGSPLGVITNVNQSTLMNKKYIQIVLDNWSDRTLNLDESLKFTIAHKAMPLDIQRSLLKVAPNYLTRYAIDVDPSIQRSLTEESLKGLDTASHVTRWREYYPKFIEMLFANVARRDTTVSLAQQLLIHGDVPVNKTTLPIVQGILLKRPATLANMEPEYALEFIEPEFFGKVVEVAKGRDSYTAGNLQKIYGKLLDEQVTSQVRESDLDDNPTEAPETISGSEAAPVSTRSQHYAKVREFITGVMKTDPIPIVSSYTSFDFAKLAKTALKMPGDYFNNLVEMFSLKEYNLDNKVIPFKKRARYEALGVYFLVTPNYTGFCLAGWYGSGGTQYQLMRFKDKREGDMYIDLLHLIASIARKKKSFDWERDVSQYQALLGNVEDQPDVADLPADTAEDEEADQVPPKKTAEDGPQNLTGNAARYWAGFNHNSTQSDFPEVLDSITTTLAGYDMTAYYAAAVVSTRDAVASMWGIANDISKKTEALEKFPLKGKRASVALEFDTEQQVFQFFATGVDKDDDPAGKRVEMGNPCGLNDVSMRLFALVHEVAAKAALEETTIWSLDGIAATKENIATIRKLMGFRPKLYAGEVPENTTLQGNDDDFAEPAAQENAGDFDITGEPIADDFAAPANEAGDFDLSAEPIDAEEGTAPAPEADDFADLEGDTFDAIPEDGAEEPADDFAEPEPVTYDIEPDVEDSIIEALDSARDVDVSGIKEEYVAERLRFFQKQRGFAVKGDLSELAKLPLKKYAKNALLGQLYSLQTIIADNELVADNTGAHIGTLGDALVELCDIAIAKLRGEEVPQPVTKKLTAEDFKANIDAIYDALASLFHGDGSSSVKSSDDTADYAAAGSSQNVLSFVEDVNAIAHGGSGSEAAANFFNYLQDSNESAAEAIIEGALSEQDFETAREELAADKLVRPALTQLRVLLRQFSMSRPDDVAPEAAGDPLQEFFTNVKSGASKLADLDDAEKEQLVELIDSYDGEFSYRDLADAFDSEVPKVPSARVVYELFNSIADTIGVQMLDARNLERVLELDNTNASLLKLAESATEAFVSAVAGLGAEATLQAPDEAPSSRDVSTVTDADLNLDGEDEQDTGEQDNVNPDGVDMTAVGAEVLDAVKKTITSFKRMLPQEFNDWDFRQSFADSVSDNQLSDDNEFGEPAPLEFTERILELFTDWDGHAAEIDGIAEEAGYQVDIVRIEDLSPEAQENYDGITIDDLDRDDLDYVMHLMSTEAPVRKGSQPAAAPVYSSVIEPDDFDSLQLAEEPASNLFGSTVIDVNDVPDDGPGMDDDLAALIGGGKPAASKPAPAKPAASIDDDLSAGEFEVAGPSKMTNEEVTEYAAAIRAAKPSVEAKDLSFDVIPDDHNAVFRFFRALPSGDKAEYARYLADKRPDLFDTIDGVLREEFMEPDWNEAGAEPDFEEGNPFDTAFNGGGADEDLNPDTMFGGDKFNTDENDPLAGLLDSTPSKQTVMPLDRAKQIIKTPINPAHVFDAYASVSSELDSPDSYERLKSVADVDGNVTTQEIAKVMADMIVNGSDLDMGPLATIRTEVVRNGADGKRALESLLVDALGGADEIYAV